MNIKIVCQNPHLPIAPMDYIMIRISFVSLVKQVVISVMKVLICVLSAYLRTRIKMESVIKVVLKLIQ